MSLLTMTSFVTLDGVMQAPGGKDEDRSGGFEQGGWVMPHWDETTDAEIAAIFGRADAFLLGRGTYQIFAGWWPKVTDAHDPVASALNRLPKHVASTTLRTLDWGGAELVPGDVVAGVRALKARYPRELQVHGSPGLAQTLLAHGLVDELNAWTFPVVVGKGKRLFGPGVAPTGWTLSRSKISAKGVVLATYRNAGQPALQDVHGA